MADLALRFNRDMLVLSTSMIQFFANHDFDINSERNYVVLCEPELIDEEYKLESVIGTPCFGEAIFKELYTQMKNGTLYKKKKEVMWMCSGCGHMAMGKEAWDTCPLCGAKQGTVYLKLESLSNM